MRYFVGKHPANHVPVGNGRALALLQQYAQRKFDDPDMQQYSARKPIDCISKLLYPYYDRESSLVGPGGIYQSVIDVDERVGYDFYETWDSPFAFEKSSGYLSVDKTRFVNGTGVYEVTSHKGYNVVMTTTWIPQDTDALVRKIEVSSYCKNARRVEIYPQIHLLGNIEAIEDILVTSVKQKDCTVFLAVGCPGSDAWHHGDFHRDWRKGSKKRVHRLHPKPETRQISLFVFTAGFRQDDGARRHILLSDWEEAGKRP